MKPMFTLHIGEYLVGDYIERTYPRWSVWVPSKDTGIDLLLSNSKTGKTASLQVKFSKDFNPSHGSPLLQSRLLAMGWWTLKTQKIRVSKADFWVFVLPSFVEKQTSFIVLPPRVLLRRLQSIHGRSAGMLHAYLRVTKTKRCWETRGLAMADQEMVALDRYPGKDREFTEFLNAWQLIEKKLK